MHRLNDACVKAKYPHTRLRDMHPDTLVTYLDPGSCVYHYYGTLEEWLWASW